MVEDDPLDEHPEEHRRLAVLDQRVERLTQKRLKINKNKNKNIDTNGVKI